jgi:hypothetical protein
MRVEEKSTFVTRLAGHSPSPENCGLTLAHLDFSRARLHFAKFHHSREWNEMQPRHSHSNLRQEMG